MNEGKLVPEEIIFGLLSKRLEEGYWRGETGFILEGIPRTRIQAVSSNKMGFCSNLNSNFYFYFFLYSCILKIFESFVSFNCRIAFLFW